MDLTVFAVQMQMRYDTDKRELVPRFHSIERAEKWGKIKFVLTPSANPFALEEALGEMHSSLSGFSDSDYLLLIGNPVLIGMATTVAAHYNSGRVKFLQWSGRHGQYSEIVTEIV
jgi:hypothetical protein